ncbi:hypothetical protein YC2023_037782 [Brassica napus]
MLSMCWTQICTKSLLRILVLFGIRIESVHFDLMDESLEKPRALQYQVDEP